MSTPFVRVATVVANQLTELFQTPVFVSERTGAPVLIGAFGPMRAVADTGYAGSQCLRFPLYAFNKTGEVLIGSAKGAEKISPRIARACIDFVVEEAVRANQSRATAQWHSEKDSVIRALLAGEVSSYEETVRRADAIGLDLAPPRAAIVIDARAFVCNGEEGKEGRSRRIIDSIVGFFHLPNENICADLGDGQFVAIKASDSKNMEPWAKPMLMAEDEMGNSSTSWTNLEALKRSSASLLDCLQAETQVPINIGLGRYHPGLSGIACSYQDARVALRLGRQFAEDTRLHCLDELGVVAFACVADEHTKVTLALHLLSPLDNQPDLLRTLEVFFAENCAPIATAKRLVVHRNTLTYRLEKIHSLTGLDPRRFDDAMQIRLALLLRSLGK